MLVKDSSPCLAERKRSVRDRGGVELTHFPEVCDREPASGQCFALGHRHFLLSFKPLATQHMCHITPSHWNA